MDTLDSLMPASLRFLIAAKRCEVAELAQLAQTSPLIRATAALVHELQRERGLSNLYLAAAAAQGSSHSQRLAEHIEHCQPFEAHVLLCFEQMRLSAQDNSAAPTALPGHGARLFNRMADVLQGLAALPHLRQKVATRAWPITQATPAYSRLVAALLGVVFEAADSASDPDASRLLVALFHFMQGKEWAGQERATGAALLSAGRADASLQQRLLHLIESQERSFQMFHEFASPSLQTLAHTSQDTPQLAELERLRRIICTTPAGHTLSTPLSRTWFETCSQRLDHMKAVEERLTLDLLTLCRHKTDTAQRDLQAWEALLSDPQGHPTMASPVREPSRYFEDAPPPMGDGLTASEPPAIQGRPVIELVREQSQRLAAMAAELDTIRASLNERKLIERAKGLLMAHRQLNEDQAHKLLRQTAMSQNRRLVDVAEAVLAMAHVWPRT
jgi:hypothetical protein